MRLSSKFAFVMIVLGMAGLCIRPALATNPADMQTWYTDSTACSIFQVLVITDEQNPDNKAALVSFGDGSPSSYAKWTQSAGTLTLYEFKDRPHDTFVGTINGNSLAAAHTWLPKRHRKAAKENCTFTLG